MIIPMLPVVLLLALWLAVNVGVVIGALVRRSARQSRATSVVAQYAPVEARTSATFGAAHTA